MWIVRGVTSFVLYFKIILRIGMSEQGWDTK
jgi:hypothetical protein